MCTSVKNLSKCPFCGGIVSVRMGIGGDYVFTHKPNGKCPVKNSVRFETQSEAVKFWKQRKKTRKCPDCEVHKEVINGLRSRLRYWENKGDTI